MSEIQRITIEDNEEFLRQVSKEVDFSDKSYLDDIKKLEEYCTNNEVFAMAAVQIGILKRIIYLKNTTTDISKNSASNYNEAKVMINPKVISRKGYTKYLEGCASCIDTSGKEKMYYAGIVERPYLVEIEYYNIDGEKKNEILTNFAATVFSHEYDHLNGILHMDIATDIFKLTTDEMKLYRKEHPYEILDKDSEYNISI